MKLEEDQLSADIRAGRIERVYFLYGKEPFLVKTYVDRLIKKTVGEDALDFNLVRISGNPDMDMLSDHVDGLPVFADMKLISVNDIDPEKIEKEAFERLLSIIADVPEITILLFNNTGVSPDERKSQTKKFIAAVEKAGVVCKMDAMPQPKIAELVIKKAAKQGVVISREDALYLTERVLCSLNLISEETAKLISYVGKGGVITRGMIDSLVAKQLDTSVYELATAINSGKREQAFGIVSDLIFQRVEPVVILSALSGTYLDFYRAKIAKMTGVLPNQAAEEFSYAKNRVWVLSKAMNAVSKLRVGYLRKTLEILNEADIMMKSSPIDSRTVIEQAIAKLFIAQREKSA